MGITPPQLSKGATDKDANEHEAKDVESVVPEAKELVEKDIRDRFKKMCEGYFQSVSKKLVAEHNVCGIRTRLVRVPERQYSRGYRNRIAETMKHIFGLERFLRTANKPTRR